MIHVNNVWKSYDQLIAVRDFSLHVPKGETLGLIGPNGSGKTTLLRMICSLAKPDIGEIIVDGSCCIREPREVRRKLNFMPAEFGVPREMTIKEFMDYFACALGVSPNDRDARVRDVMELTDLAGREGVLMGGLSTGNKQRVLLAKSLLSDADLLILDEPASGLDPRARAEVRALLKELANMGKTIVISSHILADLEDICSSICIIENGKKVVGGTVEDLRNGFRTQEKVIKLVLPTESIELAAELLKRDARIVATRQESAKELFISCSEESNNFILKILIDHDIEILGLSEDTPDLEDIFMGTTKGIVS